MQVFLGLDNLTELHFEGNESFQNNSDADSLAELGICGSSAPTDILNFGTEAAPVSFDLDLLADTCPARVCEAEPFVSVFLASDTDVLVGSVAVPETSVGVSIDFDCPDENGYSGTIAVTCGDDGDWSFSSSEIFTDDCVLGEFRSVYPMALPSVACVLPS